MAEHGYGTHHKGAAAAKAKRMASRQRVTGSGEGKHKEPAKKESHLARVASTY